MFKSENQPTAKETNDSENKNCSPHNVPVTDHQPKQHWLEIFNVSDKFKEQFINYLHVINSKINLKHLSESIVSIKSR